MRLDKWIVHSTELSRQMAQRAIRAGRVCVNGTAANNADMHILATDQITLDGTAIAPPQPRYFMLHKPAGYVCANTDSEHPTVLDLLQTERKHDLQIAGRLDLDTTGLVLITDDGAWNHRLTAPSRQCEKTYLVTLQQALTEAGASQLRDGIQLHGEKKPTQPAQLDKIDNNPLLVRLTIHEGKYHQVKRMFAAIGNHVTALHRERVGHIVLDPSLAPGEYKPLTANEVANV